MNTQFSFGSAKVGVTAIPSKYLVKNFIGCGQTTCLDSCFCVDESFFCPGFYSQKIDNQHINRLVPGIIFAGCNTYLQAFVSVIHLANPSPAVL
jgi:hypothetical protein